MACTGWSLICTKMAFFVRLIFFVLIKMISVNTGVKGGVISFYWRNPGTSARTLMMDTNVSTFHTFFNKAAFIRKIRVTLNLYAAIKNAVRSDQLIVSLFLA